MDQKKTKVTVVGSVLAKPGTEFVYLGKTEECCACSIAKVCHNLEIGKRYRVMAIRASTHTCPVHHMGAITVDVTEIPTEISLPVVAARKNTTITARFPCNELDCKNYGDCHPLGVQEGQKYIITDLLESESESCPLGLKLVKARIIPLPGELPRYS